MQNGRDFDPYDILANVIGSMGAIGASTWYHKRMLDRKRQAKYDVVPGEDVEHDVELGEGSGGQETGITHDNPRTQTLEEEVDNWDENAEDWEEDDVAGAAGKAAGDSKADDEPKKRVD